MGGLAPSTNFGGHKFGGHFDPRLNVADAGRAQEDWINKAAQAQLKAINEAIALINSGYAPYKDFGSQAIKRLTDLYSDPSSVRQTPGYDFRFNEGQRALENSAAARGKLLSGQTGQALTKYGQDYGDTFYGTELGRASNLASMGNTWDMGTADRLANLATGKGQVEAAKYGNLSNYAFWHEQQGMDEAKQWSGWFRGLLGGGGMGGGMGGGGQSSGGGGGGGGGGAATGGNAGGSFGFQSSPYSYNYNGGDGYYPSMDQYYGSGNSYYPSNTNRNQNFRMNSYL